MNDLKGNLASIDGSPKMEILLGNFLDSINNCDKKDNVVNSISPDDIIELIMEILSQKAEYFSDKSKQLIIDFLDKHKTKLRKSILSIENLEIINKSKSPTLSWIKLESFLKSLIKYKIYEPKRVANELLELTKIEIDKSISSRFASTLSGCVEYCREFGGLTAEEEEEEKWCEIIDWMSWFIGGESGDL